jgi:hypothetical protein
LRQANLHVLWGKRQNEGRIFKARNLLTLCFYYIFYLESIAFWDVLRQYLQAKFGGIMHSVELADLRNDIRMAVGQAIERSRIVNVSEIAEEVRCRHAHLNIAREDIEAIALDFARISQFPILFDDAEGSRWTGKVN